jgi:hypothetical protein
MPKPGTQHNDFPTDLLLSPGLIAVHKPRPISDLIHGPASRLRHLATRSRAAVEFRDLVQSALPGSLAGHVTAAAWRPPELTVWLDSPAFCARMRFEAPRLKTTLARATGIAIERLRVRVKP